MGSRGVPPPPIHSIFSDKTHVGLSKLLDDLLKLSEDSDSADIVFIVGREREEERVYAHKIMFMARCKSFQNAKRGEICRIPGSSVTPTAHGAPTPIRLPNVNAEVFRQFVIYIYTGKITLEDSRVFEMMTLAQDIGVDELKMACEDHVISTLSVTNACTLLTAVTEIQEKASGAKCTASFMQRCITFIGENAAESVKTNSFLNLSKDGLIKLISSDYFCLEEEDVWRSVLAWAKHKAGVTQPTAHWTEEERSRVCQNLSGVMGHVRLLLIDSQVFAEEVEPTGAVPMELSLERYRLAALQTSNKLPIGLNNNNNNSLSSSGGGIGGGVNGIGSGGGSIVSGHTGPLSESDKRLQPRLSFNMFPGSCILKNDKLHLQRILNNWYGVPKQNWTLIFRASTHNYSAAAFHQHCDNISPTFVIATNDRGDVSGGFSDVAWSQTHRKGGFIPSERAFLFALSVNGGSPTKFDIQKKPYAICYHQDHGPIFGGGADLLITDDCNNNMNSYSNLQHSYDGPCASVRSLFSDYHFLITEYEVYTLSDLGSKDVTNKIKHERYQ